MAKKANRYPKAYYGYVQSRSTKREAVGCIRQKDNTLATTNSQKAIALCEHFQSVHAKDEGILRPIHQPVGSTLMEQSAVLPGEMEKTLVSLGRGKAAGPDEMHPALLGPLGSILAAPLAHLFNLSMATATLPQDWKVANVAPIHKGGERELATNYRPVSLLPVILKVMG
ncbi:unnamed protein product [Echinostoma caproni]|uniref:Rna-directed dna polymerase from mobile element jockey-like n=1 Tax=Echinostoma caproni TaxID=27848 RepID=A0A183A934_9TREM|nr:unnamed protein product [Echinostoma caproni]